MNQESNLTPNEVAAIRQVPVPTNVRYIQRLLGTVNQTSKFASNLADVTNPLRDLRIQNWHRIDLTHLNDSVCSERYSLQAVDQRLTQV